MLLRLAHSRHGRIPRHRRQRGGHQPRARRKRLHRRHHGRRPRRGSAGDMDRRGRLHDRRPQNHRQRLRHRGAILHRGHGALQLRREGDLPSDDLPRLSQEYPYPCEEHLQSIRPRHENMQPPGPCPETHQGNLFHQRHMPRHDHQPLHGRRDRRELQNLQCSHQAGSQRLPCLPGRE